MTTEKIFPYSESTLLKIAAKFNKELSLHRSAISGFDQEINELFEQEFQNALELSITHPQNKTLNKETVRLHGEIETMIEEVKQHIIFIKYYFLKTFPHDPTIWEQFGYCEIENTSHNYFKLQICLEKLVNTVEERQNELGRSKFPFERVKEIERLARKIDEKNHQIIEYYEINDKSDNERIDKLNELYRLMQQIDFAARKYRISHHEEFQTLLLP